MTPARPRWPPSEEAVTDFVDDFLSKKWPAMEIPCRTGSPEQFFHHADVVECACAALAHFTPPAPEADPERIAQLIAHRACHSAEHDPQAGKLHGFCIVCGVPWPCEYAGKPPAPPAPEVASEEDHEWIQFDGYTACRKCTVIKRADGANGPCKGKVGISLRAARKEEEDGYKGYEGTVDKEVVEKIVRAARKEEKP